MYIIKRNKAILSVTDINHVLQLVKSHR